MVWVVSFSVWCWSGSSFEFFCFFGVLSLGFSLYIGLREVCF